MFRPDWSSCEVEPNDDQFGQNMQFYKTNLWIGNSDFKRMMKNNIK
jgi:hypothetical protein